MNEKQPYQQPAIVWEIDLETRAGSSLSPLLDDLLMQEEE